MRLECVVALRLLRTAMLAGGIGVACTSTRAVIDESHAEPATLAPAPDEPGAGAGPRQEAMVTPQRPATEDPGASSRVELPTGAKPTEVGYSDSLGDHHFRIWGSASTGKMPKALATTRHGLLVSSNMGSDGGKALSVYHTDPLRLKMHVPLEGEAIELAISPDDSKVYVSNDLEWGILQVLDARTFEVSKTVAVPGFPKWMSVNRAGTKLFASLWQLDGVTEVTLPEGTTRTFRGRKGTISKSKSKNPRGSALSGDERTLFVGNNADQSLSIIDTKTLTERKRIRIGYAPRHIVANRDGSRIYISLTGEERIVEFDVNSEAVTRSFAVGKRPKTIVLANDERFLYSANFVGNSLSIVDLQTEEALELSLDLYKPSGLSLRGDDAFIYITGFCTNDVWAVQRIDPGGSPHLPLGADRDNNPCLTCFSTFAGCPYPPGTEPKALVEAAKLGQ